MKTLYEAGDVDDAVLVVAADAEEFFPGRIDWDRYWDRLETLGYSIEDTTSPAARKIERHVHALRRDGK